MKKCKYCGAWIDAGETCDCENGTRTFESVKLKKRHLTAEELKAKLERMSYKEYDEYRKSFSIVQCN